MDADVQEASYRCAEDEKKKLQHAIA